jgi:DNA modification methylase
LVDKAQHFVTQSSLFDATPFETELKEDIFSASEQEVNGETQENDEKRANELNGGTWIKYSISIWSDLRKTPEEIALKHPAMFPIALPERLMLCFTTSKDKIVIDPFAGIGSTIVAAHRLHKIGIGIELSEEYAQKANERINPVSLFSELEEEKSPSRIYRDNARNLLNYVKPNSVDFGVTSPPYWDILTQKRTADYKEVRTYNGNKDEDLGNISDYRQFIDSLRPIFERVYTALKPGKYFCVNVMDIRKKDKLYPLHEDVKNLMCSIGFKYDDVIIWDRRHEYNNMRPLGYPSVFRINRAHEYILIFLKPLPAKNGSKTNGRES